MNISFNSLNYEIFCGPNCKNINNSKLAIIFFLQIVNKSFFNKFIISIPDCVAVEAVARGGVAVDQDLLDWEKREPNGKLQRKTNFQNDMPS